MGKASRDKGKRREREIVQAHLDLGIHAERVPLSGGTRYQGNGSDVDVYLCGKDNAPTCCEVKARASGSGFKTLETWLGENDALFLVRDRSSPIVVLPWSTYSKLIATKAGVPRL
jgi:hypothetical protein